MGPRVIGILSVLAASAAAQSAPSGDDILARAADASTRRHETLRTYSGMRHYTVTNRRFNMEATGTVQMSYVEGKGAHLEVLSTSGSERLGSVIHRIADSEEELSRSPERTRADLHPSNYSARLIGTELVGGRSCYVLAVKPKFKSKHLIDGKAWIDSETYSLVRIEGQFAASVSAFLGRPYFTQEFTEVSGYWLPLRAHASSSTFLLGSSELEVEYVGYDLGAGYHASQTYAENWRATPKRTRR
jgi:hypothetical protein